MGKPVDFIARAWPDAESVLCAAEQIEAGKKAKAQNQKSRQAGRNAIAKVWQGPATCGETRSIIFRPLLPIVPGSCGSKSMSRAGFLPFTGK